MTGFTQIIPFISDGNDGFYISWHNYTYHGFNASAWIQHVNAEGEIQFEHNGVLLSDRHEFNQFYLQITSPENESDIYTYWREVNGDQNQYGLYGQKVDENGNILWANDGKAIFEVDNENIYPFAAGTVDNDVVLIYAEDFLKATRLDENGDFAWFDPINATKVNISTATSSHDNVVVSEFDGSQWAIFRDELRDGVKNIYGQNLLHHGAIGMGNTQPDIYNLSLEIIGNGTVEINSMPYLGSVEVEAGIEYQLVAIPDVAWQFGGWVVMWSMKSQLLLLPLTPIWISLPHLMKTQHFILFLF